MFENTSIQYRFSAPNNLPEVIVPAEVRHNIFLSCKEALHNVVRHSHATTVLVQVTFENSTLKINIEDNGCGFDPSAIRAHGNGLSNMQKRLEKLGGRFDLESKPGGGTRICMTVVFKPVERI